MDLPLSGYRIVELAGLGPAPYAGMLLADMGAEVILVSRPNGPPPVIQDRGKHPVAVDLRKPGGAQIVLDLIAESDALIEGLRPGVAERLGVGPDAAHAVNPRLVYGRMTGWGQTGPWAKTAGHDLNYISITGALHATGERGRPPMPPLNFVGDYGGGSLFLVAGVLAGLLSASRTKRGTVVDAAMIDGATSMMSIVHTLAAFGQWSTERQSNLIDGSRPFYRCYQCADGKFMAVACIEPQFFAEFLRVLEIDPDGFGGQNDASRFAEQHARLEALFRTRPRDAWAALFDGTDACTTPVLDYVEAQSHPQLAARNAVTKQGPWLHARPAPVFGSDLSVPDFAVPAPNSALDHVAALLDYDPARIAALKADGVLQ